MDHRGAATVATGDDGPAGPLLRTGILLGIGIAGFVDEALFHQLLQWHTFYWATDQHGRILSDGLFHIASTLALRPRSGAIVDGVGDDDARRRRPIHRVLRGNRRRQRPHDPRAVLSDHRDRRGTHALRRQIPAVSALSSARVPTTRPSVGRRTTIGPPARAGASPSRTTGCRDGAGLVRCA